MRKTAKLITGFGVVASFGVALAPLGVFAANYEMGTDHIEVTITASCNMETDGYDPAQDETFENNYSDVLGLGSHVDLGGNNGGGTATTIKVICNDAEPADQDDPTYGTHGYQITATPTALTGETTNALIPMVNPVTDGSASGWGAKYSKSGSGDMAITAGFEGAYGAFAEANTAEIIASGHVSDAEGDVLTIDGYRVSASDSQTADTYSASITYTFVRPIN